MKDKKDFIILGIETSCDETAASLLKVSPSQQGSRQGETLEILSNVIASQVDIHRQYGGIVPEIAARAHIEKIIPVINKALTLAGIQQDISHRKIESSIQLIAVTNGPGLITSLLVGVETAKTLSYLWQKPLLPINHLVGHIYAAFGSEIQNSRLYWQAGKFKIRNLFPIICLVVSGGHTELVLMKSHGQFKKIGQTLDDAAGECFDKVAKLLNIGYPGGPAIAHHAQLSNIQNLKSRIQLPRPMIKSKDFNFSFSGLKTAVLYKIKNKKIVTAESQKISETQKDSEIQRLQKKLPQKIRSEKKQFIRAICAETQQAIIDVLINKTIRAVREFKAKSVILCGGVAANQELREQLKFKIDQLPIKINFLVPAKNLCTDNATMIALAAYFKYKNLSNQQKKKLKNNWQKIVVNSNLDI